MEQISRTIQFVSLAEGKTFILSTASPREHSLWTNLNNKHINCFHSVSPLNSQNKNCPMDLTPEANHEAVGDRAVILR